MKIKRSRSIKDFLIRIILAFSLAFLLIITVYTVRSLISLNHEIDRYNDAAVEVYQNSFDEVLERISNENSQLLLNNIAVKSLSQSSFTDNTRISSEFYLREILPMKADPFEVIFFYNPQMDYLLFYYGTDVADDARFLENSAFMHYFSRLIDSGNYVFNQWFVYTENEKQLLFNVLHSNQGYICSIVDPIVYCKTHPAGTYDDIGILVLSNSSDVIYTTESSELSQKNKWLLSSVLKDNVSIAYSDCCDLTFQIITPSNVYPDVILPYLLIYFICIWAIVIMVVFFMRVINKTLLFPIHEITLKSAELAGKDIQEPTESQRDFIEYDRIREALFQLVEQKKELEAQYLTTQEQKEHALLQYYQMQTRSHFFINCLKSLYSMADKGNAVQMKAMIIAFSNHLRYIFHDNLIKVTLQEELKEVDDYHKIISMDLNMPLLVNKKIPKELLNTPVPPLTIQTFLENTYKYADRKRGLLLFQMEASEVELDGKRYMRLHLYDNGGGYDEDILNSLKEDIKDKFEKDHVGINNLRHRMQIIYGDLFKDAYYNEADGAHSVLYLPLEEEKKNEVEL